MGNFTVSYKIPKKTKYNIYKNKGTSIYKRISSF